MVCQSANGTIEMKARKVFGKTTHNYPDEEEGERRKRGGCRRGLARVGSDGKSHI